MSSDTDKRGGRRRWSILAVLSFLLAVAAALASFFWQTIWRSPFQRWAEPRYVIGAALVAMIISGVVGFVFKPQKKRGVWLAWIALALSFGTLVSFNLMTGDMLKNGQFAGAEQKQQGQSPQKQTAAGEPNKPAKVVARKPVEPNELPAEPGQQSEPNAATRAVEPNEPKAAEPNEPPASIQQGTEPNVGADTSTKAVAEVNEPEAVEANAIDPNAPATEVMRIKDEQFRGFAQVVEDVRQRRFDDVYGRFTELLKQEWPRDKFVEDMNNFRDEIGDKWRLRPTGFSGGYDEKGAYFLCAVVLADSNDYQIFAELAAKGDSFEINRLTPMRMKMVDKDLADRIRTTATCFVATLMSGDYIATLKMFRPRTADEPTAESLAHIRRAIRGGTFNTPQFVFSSVDWMIECGRNQYGIEAMPLNSTGTQLRMVLYEPNAPELALDFVQFTGDKKAKP